MELFQVSNFMIDDNCLMFVGNPAELEDIRRELKKEFASYTIYYEVKLDMNNEKDREILKRKKE